LFPSFYPIKNVLIRCIWDEDIKESVLFTKHHALQNGKYRHEDHQGKQ
jgi:hypothetical protein